MVVEEAGGAGSGHDVILGLVAEPVPIKSIDQPRGDRLDVVKGRQIIDKFNCAGCHMIRPGVFDFNVGKQTGKLLERTTSQQGPGRQLPRRQQLDQPRPRLQRAEAPRDAQSAAAVSVSAIRNRWEMADGSGQRVEPQDGPRAAEPGLALRQ